jgi:hypothetical protein
MNKACVAAVCFVFVVVAAVWEKVNKLCGIQYPTKFDDFFPFLAIGHLLC